MTRPKLEDFKRDVHDGQDYADWYREYFTALEKYTDELEKALNSKKDTARKPLSCPKCENTYPRLYQNNTLSCDKCGHMWHMYPDH